MNYSKNKVQVSYIVELPQSNFPDYPEFPDLSRTLSVFSDLSRIPDISRFAEISEKLQPRIKHFASGHLVGIVWLWGSNPE